MHVSMRAVERPIIPSKQTQRTPMHLPKANAPRTPERARGSGPPSSLVPLLVVHSPVDETNSWRGGQVAHVPGSEQVAHDAGQATH
jgi:hypothetical protein